MNDKIIEKAKDEVVFRVAQLFLAERSQADELARRKASSLAKFVADTIKAEFPNEKITRQMVWPLATEALRRGFLILIPPFETQMQQGIAEKYPHLADRIHVVRTASHHDNRKVATVAASIALKRAKTIWERSKGKPLGLGLGPGRATRDFCEAFSKLVFAERNAPKLDLYAISAGCPAREPENASISFFNLFDDQIVNSRTGVFAEALVCAREFADVRTRAGVKEAYQHRENINLVVTSMGDHTDEHDLLRLFLQESGVDVDAQCKAGWVGNVQYRPYTLSGAVKEKSNELRAVTLFELADLAEMADRDDKEVILIARQCGRCQRTRAKALAPLLAPNSNLRVFSTLVMDSATCQELLQGES